MTKIGKTTIVVVALILLSVVVFFLQRNYNTSTPATPIEENKILGKYEDLVDFSILPGSKLSGEVSYHGSVKGGWFFEGNILINILDTKGNVLKNSNTSAKTEWMTVEPVEFEGTIDLTDLPKGPAYFEIHNDNASGEPANDKFIEIPIVIE